MNIRIDRVTTRGGDGGQTSLGDGSRVAKDDPRIEAIGAVDELNAFLGMLHHAAPEVAYLSELQNALFDLGADLCQPHVQRACSLNEEAVVRLEQETEVLRVRQEPLSSFVLPGGTNGACWAHLARTVARRAERRVVALHDAQLENAARFLNRLSDYLFVLARYENDDGRSDILWNPKRGL
ncbi:cob(I)yrinic acid a,c-diamide adenosyltransferase [Kozakia baliensis]|uniref:cob(I)yrinic acid a,c-diamide adenosyltransferase n=1 Tax=Kozakia baliensis TaxID=153496 RepID=UPI00087B70B1|nr:cob(I)yrinic acid a,c-diamide adenosyltransferase [Kozakia baliensis]AOX19590.1 cob(I)yrinic acid a c-diamide adenosyltransferase [Kozakia baliensis]